MDAIMANNASDTRIRKAKGSATVPVIWHLQREGGRDFTIGVYPGICESWNVAKNQWVRIASGFLAEIKERIAPQPAGAKAGPRPYNSTGGYLLYATRDEAHTLALRRVYTIVTAGDNA
jgi:hypothetical protein